MRRTFAVRSLVRSARLYVTALGGYEMRLNGRKVGRDALAPECTDFRRCALYRVFDVRDLLISGANVLGAVVGDGWFASFLIVTGRYPYSPAPRRLLAQLEVNYVDGSRQIISTDRDWKADRAPILSSEMYNGEWYDARLEQRNWDSPDFDDSLWSPVWIAPVPEVQLISQTSPPIRAVRRLHAVAINEPTPGIHVFDFGQNFAGWASLRIRAVSGQKITMRFAEILKPDGRVDQSNLGLAEAMDVYIARGDPSGEIHEPRFTYHGFRYVEVEGLKSSPSLDVIEGIVVHSDLSETGRFEIDSPLIQKLWENTFWTQRSNFLGVPTDCPQRAERLAWTGDARPFWDTAAFNMDVAAFTRRFMGDIRQGQSPTTGAFDLWAPKADDVLCPLSSSTPGWADAGIELPWVTYLHYGDRSIVDENWEAMTRFLTGILRENPDHIWRNGRGMDFGDWYSLDGKQPWHATTPKDLLASALLARACDHMADLADWTGRKEEAVLYRRHADQTKSAFAEAFIASEGVIGNGSQAGYVLALYTGCVPRSLRQAAARRLTADIRRRGTLLSTGFLGTCWSLDVVAEHGDAALVYDLLLRTEYPSWGYTIRKDATTIWESWDADGRENSHNHYALGSVCGFLYRRVAGIDPIAPGFSRVRIRPLLDPRIRSAGADYDSVRGRILTRWTFERHKLNLTLVLPASCAAVVHLPSTVTAGIAEGGERIESHRDVRVLSDQGETVLEVGSGVYRFEVNCSSTGLTYGSETR